MDFIDVPGASGVAYRFRLWPRGERPPPMAGNYIVARKAQGPAEVMLVGVTSDLSRVNGDELRTGAGVQLFTRLNFARAIRTAEHADIVAGHAHAAVAEADI
jgi:hypothetical protein